MGRNDTTSAIIDGLLKFAAFGGMLSVMIMAPNAVQALDKPLRRYFDGLDERERHREYMRILRNMKKQGLISYKTDDYEHGIQITRAGRKRAKQADYKRLRIERPKKWDQHWRMVFFDIPEQHKASRDQFAKKLRQLGFIQLQRSVWVHPFQCRKEIEIVAQTLEISQYITYIETNYIDAAKKLRARFKPIL